MSSNTHGASVWFRDNLDVSFFGSKVLCSAATLTALKLISTSGLTATYGTNVLDVNATNTTITGPVILNGNVSGTGITQLLSMYLTSASINGKEDSITVSAPLLKATPTYGPNAGKNVLYLDTTAAYTVGNLTATGVVSGIGFTNLLSGKENLITATGPLLKTSANGLTQLSLDTAADYTVGSLTSTGQLTCSLSLIHI